MDNSHPTPNQTKTILEVANLLQIPRNTVRNFCNRGLVPHVRRDAKHQRIFEPWQVDLLGILINMRQAGFRSRELKRYSALYRQGSKTSAERLAMLTTRKRQLWQEIADRQAAIDFIERWEETHQSQGSSGTKPH